MTHDPLCPWKCDCGEVHNEMECEKCDLIAKVREDTIAAAVQRVEALNHWEEHVREFVHRDEAIAAIKGDQP